MPHELTQEELLNTIVRLQTENETMHDILDEEDYMKAAMSEINTLKSSKESLELRLDAAMEETRRLRASLRISKQKQVIQ